MAVDIEPACHFCIYWDTLTPTSTEKECVYPGDIEECQSLPCMQLDALKAKVARLKSDRDGLLMALEDSKELGYE